MCVVCSVCVQCVCVQCAVSCCVCVCKHCVCVCVWCVCVVCVCVCVCVSVCVCCPHHTVWCVCVCVCLSCTRPDAARHTPANSVAMLLESASNWLPQSSGHGDTGLSAGWRLTKAAKTRGPSEPHVEQWTTQGWPGAELHLGVYGGLSLCGSPQGGSHSRQLPTTPSTWHAQSKYGSATRQYNTSLHPIACRHGHHSSQFSYKGCRQGCGSEAARTSCPPPHSPTHRGGGVCVCGCRMQKLSLHKALRLHVTHSPPPLPTTPSHSLVSV